MIWYPTTMAHQYLKNIELFHEISDEDLQGIHGIMEETFLGKDSILFYEGQQGHSVYILLEGKIQVNKDLDVKAPVEIASLGPNDILGELALIRDGKRTCSARATESSRLMVASRTKLMTLFRERPQVWAQIVTNTAVILANRLEVMNRMVSQQLLNEPKNSFLARLLGMAS